MSEAENTELVAFLHEHPRLMGLLFTSALLAMETIGRAEAGGAATAGP